jgi:hypothetical protein
MIFNLIFGVVTFFSLISCSSVPDKTSVTIAQTCVELGYKYEISSYPSARGNTTKVSCVLLHEKR